MLRCRGRRPRRPEISLKICPSRSNFQTDWDVCERRQWRIQRAIRCRSRSRGTSVTDAGIPLAGAWQNQGDWRVCFAHDDRAADSTVRVASPYERFAVSTVGAAISRPMGGSFVIGGRLIAAPTGAEVFERHARVGVPYGRFVGSAFTAVGRDHWARRFFIRLRSRHLSHSPLVFSH